MLKLWRWPIPKIFMFICRIFRLNGERTKWRYIFTILEIKWFFDHRRHDNSQDDSNPISIYPSTKTKTETSTSTINIKNIHDHNMSTTVDTWHYMTLHDVTHMKRKQQPITLTTTPPFQSNPIHSSSQYNLVTISIHAFLETNVFWRCLQEPEKQYRYYRWLHRINLQTLPLVSWFIAPVLCLRWMLSLHTDQNNEQLQLDERN